MSRHSHRHDDCCESPERCYEPPICWPERPSFPNFPGIATFWPMPFAVPMMPSLGAWGGMRSGYEPPYYSHRRYDMYRYRCCEPRYRRHSECCERCGEYDCRCERRCERCGEYDCRCERRCERCGRRDCRCGGYSGSRPVEFIFITAGFTHNCAVYPSQEYFDSDARLSIGQFRNKDGSRIIPAPLVLIEPDSVKITITLAAATQVDEYMAMISDENKKGSKVVGGLTLNVY